ncbi:MAG: Ppx/GppA family phosphatase [Rhodovarius sp.]|nr:Ppx/GppA family phosphatase [Rhodovarius sp.]MCX7932357.1 Ppx/GppA family phosphatase [Rhodovarius sp.]MDW8315144.1 Ppx/GppA family phosphatase [Rhodovarius sp.]
MTEPLSALRLQQALPRPPRMAVVDLGSNSVRLVVFEGLSRNPQAIFNEKAVLGLGRGLAATGRLNEEAVGQALTVLRRYHALARGMGADPLEVLATAAVRDAANGPEFLRALRAALPGTPIEVLSGEEEAQLSAEGLLLGFAAADGVLADLGGGSLELVHLQAGRIGATASLPVGTIRLAERAGGDVTRARAIVERELEALPWLRELRGADLFAVGGAFRALARMHMAQTAYPLAIVHHYAIRREEARDLAGVVMNAPRRVLERMPAAPAKRLPDLPFAAVVLRRLLRATGAGRVVFSANGLREGWYARRLPPALRRADPLFAATEELAAAFGRNPDFPAALESWLAPLRLAETPAEAALIAAAARISDIGSHDHPEYRAEQAFLRVLRQNGVGLDHHMRAFLALTLALRYEAEPTAPFLAPIRPLLGSQALRRAETLGAALRLAFTLSGGVAALLEASSLTREGGRLILRLHEAAGLFAGEAVERRLEALALQLGLEPVLTVV